LKVVDDPDSIKICGNKIHQYALIQKHNIPHIPTIFINKEVLSADFKVAIGRVTPHDNMGYAGGSKIIMPGVSGVDTININHIMFNTRFGYGTLDENPARRDIDEIAAIVGVDFILDFALWTGQFRKGFAGDLFAAHRAGVEWGDRNVWGAEIGEKADITIVSPGSSPTIRDATPALIYARRSGTKRGGTIVYLTPDEPAQPVKTLEETVEVVDSAGYRLEMLNMKLDELVRREMRFQFPTKLYHTHMGYTDIQIKHHYYQHHVIQVGGKFSEETLKREGMEHMDSLDKAVEQALKEQGKDARILVIPEGLSTMPIKEVHAAKDFKTSVMYKTLQSWDEWAGKRIPPMPQVSLIP
jgi:nickel-dependent lactate racemase